MLSVSTIQEKEMNLFISCTDEFYASRLNWYCLCFCPEFHRFVVLVSFFDDFGNSIITTTVQDPGPCMINVTFGIMFLLQDCLTCLLRYRKINYCKARVNILLLNWWCWFHNKFCKYFRLLNSWSVTRTPVLKQAIRVGFLSTIIINL